MNKMSAWEKFLTTGKVQDYLEYANIKDDMLNKPQGSVYGAGQFRRIDNKSEEYRRFR